MPSEVDGRDRRALVLVLAMFQDDAKLCAEVLGDIGLVVRACRSLDELSRELELGAGALIVTDTALSRGDPERLLEVLREQPEWSDIPVLLLAGGGIDAPAATWLMEALGNVTVIDRPVRIVSLVTAVRSAIKARRRQFQMRDQLDAIRRAQEALQEASRHKDEFLATLAHELRNPLAPISNAVYLLNVASKDEHAKARLAMMGRQLNHMVRLVDDLLEVSRITRGSVELQRDAVDFRTIVYGAIEASRPLIDAKRHHLSVTVPDHEVLMNADAVRLTQVMTNLLNNAVKYTEPRGQIDVMVEVSPADGVPREVIARVKDSGIGIPADELEDVFEMFRQVRGPDGRARGGLGIGLTLARSLVELHGGAVTARSAGPGAGTELIVRLPLLAATVHDSVHPPDASQETPATLASHRILVVDDNEDAAESLAEMLRSSAGTVETVYDGASALASLTTFEPDVVLLDIGLPDLDGYHVAERMRERRSSAQLLIVAQTGWGQAPDRLRSQAAGIDHHMVKPVDFERLVQLIASRPE